jgi:hypothetical protein
MPITHHLKDFVLNLEKLKAVQTSPMLEDKNQEGCKFFGNFIPQIEIIVIF